MIERVIEDTHLSSECSRTPICLRGSRAMERVIEDTHLSSERVIEDTHLSSGLACHGDRWVSYWFLETRFEQFITVSELNVSDDSQEMIYAIGVGYRISRAFRVPVDYSLSPMWALP